MRSAITLGLLVSLGPLGACASSGGYAPARSPGALDDVTNGLNDGASLPFGFTSAGISTFQDTDDDGLPDVRLPDFERSGGIASTGDTSVPILSYLFKSEGADGERLMTYGAGLALEVAKIDDAIAKLARAASERKGYVAERRNAQLALRIPSTELAAFLAAARDLGRVLEETMKAQEVTKQHRDLTIRLENARKARDRLLALIDKAEKVEDILKIEKEIARLTEKVETLSGELKYLNDRVALATVTVALRSRQEQAAEGRRASRFWWINQLGAEHVVHSF